MKMKVRPTNAECSTREQLRADFRRLDVIERVQDRGEAAILADLRLFRAKSITQTELRKRVRRHARATIRELRGVWPREWGFRVGVERGDDRA